MKKTMNQILEEINHEIKKHDLYFIPGADNRVRHKVYQRYYLFSFLRTHRMTLVDIGKIFGMDHSTVIYGVQQAKNMKKDRLFLRITDDLRQKFEPYTALNYTIERNIVLDVLQCESFWEMRKIQEDIKKGVYGVTM
ncbi:Chromosomal replication initiator, DnaA C-terminal [uncultured Caudovirales phage]|uniref:Chromosomal replication initiator, DnaA C-terminal n=1 Tax=uncultured Caudovirales phage TaxID=2100421 RepID=A0A6J7X3X7_9CAUD|nr:Chromosomal replication initiator, DnaA C-terminal [uncultured Caudovirales phage]